jgi:hypothetical protein
VEDGEHGGGPGFVDEGGHEVTQTHAVAGEFDLVGGFDFEERDGGAIRQIDRSELERRFYFLL